MSDTTAIQEIDIGDLDIDPENIRGVEWSSADEADKALTESVDAQGVKQPLTVRPSDVDGVKYGIVCGSRRFNAAIDAGLDTVPCIVEDLDDTEAAGLSVIENRDRKDIPAYKEAFKVIEHFHRLNGGAGKTEKVEILADRFGCGASTVRKYLELDNLPEQIRELVKDPSEWTEGTKSVVESESASLELPTKGLSVNKAAKVSRELYERSGSGGVKTPTRDEEEIVSFAAQAIEKSKEDVRTASELLGGDETISVDTGFQAARKSRIQNINVDRALDVIEGRETQVLQSDIKVTIELPNQYQSLIQAAAEKRNKARGELIKYYVKNGLENDGLDTATLEQ